MPRVLLAALVALACAPLTSCIDVWAEQVWQPFDQLMEVGGLKEVDISTGSGSITVQVGPPGRVRLNGRVYVRAYPGRSVGDAETLARELAAHPPIEFANGTLRIGQKSASTPRNVTFTFEVTVPADAPVSASTGSGRIALSGLKAGATAHTGSGGIDLADLSGTVNAQTGSGSIQADRIEGPFSSRTGSGSITLGQTGRGDVSAVTGSGSVELRGVDGGLHARTGSGSIRVDGRQAGTWDLEAGSGSVQIDLPDDAAFEVAARSGSGGVSLSHPVTTYGHAGRGRLNGQVRGGGPKLLVKTPSGRISTE